ncbi:hypothetical protein [Massilia pseudoviolaceinigra]|uniref:hypothetical protein n=1 Tax=Massilia pseudoviolaceinigra TaxID=3057165 RepID=UPI0027968091|nr:hypothetical protein [Massilia sp. CCM 9206]MDQ1924179.1 hypothetical protein [Massilia sp. CCM 9206]
MHVSKPWTSALGATANKLARALLCGALLTASRCALAQTPVMPPAEGASCTVSAVNRNAPVAPDGAFAIFNIPGETGPFRARATCSDGSVGQTAVAFPEFASELVFTGYIVWGKIDPSPVALGLSASNKRLSTVATSQLRGHRHCRQCHLARRHALPPRHHLYRQQRLAGIGQPERAGQGVAAVCVRLQCAPGGNRHQ